MEFLQVEMGIYFLERCFKMVRYQMSHCYVCSKSKTNIKKWYLDDFRANNFPALNKKDPVVVKCYINYWNHVRLVSCELNINFRLDCPVLSCPLSHPFPHQESLGLKNKEGAGKKLFDFRHPSPLQPRPLEFPYLTFTQLSLAL